jgi:hypothetical protein
LWFCRELNAGVFDGPFRRDPTRHRWAKRVSLTAQNLIQINVALASNGFPVIATVLTLRAVAPSRLGFAT